MNAKARSVVWWFGGQLVQPVPRLRAARNTPGRGLRVTAAVTRRRGGVVVWWVVASAFAADWSVVRESDGCVFEHRAEGSPDGAAMRATCTWPDVAPDPLVAMLSQYEQYPSFVWAIDAAQIRRVEGARALVYQAQRLPGIADREVMLWITKEELEPGVRFSWSVASDVLWKPSEGNIATPKNTGSWTVRPAPGGGSEVVHEIAVDAGGQIPRWVVALVRTRGFVKVLEDVRAAAVAAPSA
jgi:hypothetical protein